MVKGRIAETMVKVIDWIVKLQVIIAVIFIFFMIFTIIHGVMMRYVLRNPQSYTFEFARYSLMPLTAFALAYTQKMRGHVRVEILLMHLTGGARKILEFFSYFLSLIYTAGLLCAGSALTAVYYSDHMVSEDAQFPLWIITMFMVLGLMGFFAQLLLDIKNTFVGSDTTTEDTESKHEMEWPFRRNK